MSSIAATQQQLEARVDTRVHRTTFNRLYQQSVVDQQSVLDTMTPRARVWHSSPQEVQSATAATRAPRWVTGSINKVLLITMEESN